MSSKKKTPDNTGKTYSTHKSDYRSIEFKRAYLNSDNPQTFCNITQSAIQAGYSDEYAKNLSANTNCPKWYKEFTKQSDYLRAEMLQQAEYNLNKTLKDTPQNDTQSKIKTDVSKFVSERLGKQHYSTRQELTSKDGKRLFDIKDKDTNTELNELFVGVQDPQDV